MKRNLMMAFALLTFFAGAVKAQQQEQPKPYTITIQRVMVNKKVSLDNLNFYENFLVELESGFGLPHFVHTGKADLGMKIDFDLSFNNLQEKPDMGAAVKQIFKQMAPVPVVVMGGDYPCYSVACMQRRGGYYTQAPPQAAVGQVVIRKQRVSFHVEVSTNKDGIEFAKLVNNIEFIVELKGYWHTTPEGGQSFKVVKAKLTEIIARQGGEIKNQLAIKNTGLQVGQELDLAYSLQLQHGAFASVASDNSNDIYKH